MEGFSAVKVKMSDFDVMQTLGTGKKFPSGPSDDFRRFLWPGQTGEKQEDE